MNIDKVCVHGEWSSRLGFILAATGSAVGLGNIWKFPYMAGEYGGGAFVIIYLLCVALMGLPVMIAEVLLGKRGRCSPVNTMRLLAEEIGASRLWLFLGWAGVIAGFLILSYYSVIAGWTLAYIPDVASGTFSAVTTMPETEVMGFVGTVFNNLVSNPLLLIFWHTVFIVVTLIMLLGGVQGGLERAVRFMMPALFLLLLVLVGYAMSTPKFMAGIHFMFDIDFHKFFYPTGDKFSGEGLLAAMGQAFFSLSLGMGAIMVYGAYLPKHASIMQTTAVVVLADTLVAILAGLVIFPIVFSNGLEANQGVGLVFKTLPIAFGQMPFGSLVGALFFLLLALAAWSSAISLLEPAIAWLVETGKFTRFGATISSGIAAWLVGFATVFSFNWLADFKPLFDKTLFDLIDYITANIMLPLGGLLIAVFVAWLMKRQVITEELDLSSDSFSFEILQFLLRYVTPLGVTLVFLNAIGVFS